MSSHVPNQKSQLLSSESQPPSLSLSFISLATTSSLIVSFLSWQHNQAEALDTSRIHVIQPLGVLLLFAFETNEMHLLLFLHQLICDWPHGLLDKAMNAHVPALVSADSDRAAPSHPCLVSGSYDSTSVQQTSGDSVLWLLFQHATVDYSCIFARLPFLWSVLHRVLPQHWDVQDWNIQTTEWRLKYSKCRYLNVSYTTLVDQPFLVAFLIKCSRWCDCCTVKIPCISVGGNETPLKTLTAEGLAHIHTQTSLSLSR